MIEYYRQALTYWETIYLIFSTFSILREKFVIYNINNVETEN